jgi:nucleoid DNA-binding protein
MEVLRKLDIDRMAAMELDEPMDVVSRVTCSFLNHLGSAIIETGEVSLGGFGRFRLRIQNRKDGSQVLTRVIGGKVVGKHRVFVMRKYTITFAKAVGLHKHIKRKFGAAVAIEE